MVPLSRKYRSRTARLARRGVAGAASQKRHDSNHEETGKGDPLWGLKTAFGVWPNHGGFEAISW